MNYEQKQVQKVIDGKVTNPEIYNRFPNIAKLKIVSENAETKYINLSLSQLEKIKEILK